MPRVRSRLILSGTLDSTLNDQSNTVEVSIGSFILVERIAEHAGRLSNQISTFLSATRCQPFLTFLFVIQMNSCYVKTVYVSKFSLKLIPNVLALIINFY